MKTKEKRVCGFDGCENIHSCKGYCATHYIQFKKGKALKPIQDKRTNNQLYDTYYNMMRRCYNPKYKRYSRYGGRGITVCKTWRNNFWQFVKDMGEKPHLKYQIDRIDNDGDYKPNNCRWTTQLINSRNTSTTKLSVDKVKEIKQSLRNGVKGRRLAEKFGVVPTTISAIKTNTNWSNL